MEHLVFIKSFSVLALVVLGLIAVGLIIWQLRKAGGSLSDALNRGLDSVFGPSKVVTPKSVQDFIDQPSNTQYVPWTPTVVDDSEDETFPPKWLVKGAK
jgi:hypothetical protein